MIYLKQNKSCYKVGLTMNPMKPIECIHKNNFTIFHSFYKTFYSSLSLDGLYSSEGKKMFLVEMHVPIFEIFFSKILRYYAMMFIVK